MLPPSLKAFLSQVLRHPNDAFSEATQCFLNLGPRGQSLETRK